MQFDLEEIYKGYPRKIGKKQGMKKLATIIKTDQDFLEIKKAVDNYAKLCKSEETQSKFIKHFSTFVNNWEDYVEIEIPETFEEKLDRFLSDVESGKFDL